MRTLVGALSAATIAGAVLAGCSFNFGVNTEPVVSKERLQEDISERLAEADEEPQSVKCKDDLPGEVGAKTRCEVVISDTNSFEPIVEITGVEGTKIRYDVTPALSRRQVEKAVAGLVEEVEDVDVESVSCESGVEGKKGKKTSCEVEANDMSAQWDFNITEVKGLLMNVQVFPVLRRAAIEESLLDQLAGQLDERPDSADCSDDLVGDPGTTIECFVVLGNSSETFEVTVTTVKGAMVNYRYEPKS